MLFFSRTDYVWFDSSACFCEIAADSIFGMFSLCHALLLLALLPYWISMTSFWFELYQFLVFSF